MSPKVRRIATLALLAGVALPLMVGCPGLLNAFIRLKICLKNDTFLDLTEVNVVTSGSPSWGPNDLPGGERVLPGGEGVIPNNSPGTYDIRAIFDDKEDCVENSTVILSEVELDTTNLCITFDQVVSCDEIYVTLDYTL
ncbi:MAG: hypothetical protein KJ060_20785 [Candidatus Hydrogenedentes bacterium]|nr:hypothetical protein [Candidatus Hydrogenedentota bacterium]